MKKGMDLFKIKPKTKNILQLYNILLKEYGPQHWWPGDSVFEIVIGGLLTQNTNWGNVEKAIKKLKEEKLLSPEKILALNTERLQTLIRSSGYFRQKALRLKLLIEFFKNEGCKDFEHFKIKDPTEFRKKLLNVKGIGPETCDSILLYGFKIPVFVIDAYTKRFVKYYCLSVPDLKYETLQNFFQSQLPKDHKIYNEYHALIVKWGKNEKKECHCLSACGTHRPAKEIPRSKKHNASQTI